MSALNVLLHKVHEVAGQMERAAQRHEAEHTDESEQDLLSLELELTVLQTEMRQTLEQSGGLPCLRVGNA